MIHKINLQKYQTVTKPEIARILNDARSTYQYARFTFYNGVNLTINYHKDLKITIGTTSRDIALYREIQSLEKIFTQQRVIDFFFRWVNKLTRL